MPVILIINIGLSSITMAKLYTFEAISAALSPRILNKVHEQYITDDDECTLLDLFRAPKLDIIEQQYIIWLYDKQLWKVAATATNNEVGNDVQHLSHHEWTTELINQIQIRLEKL